MRSLLEGNMAERKHDVLNINLQIDDIEVSVSSNGDIRIYMYWSSNIGFGEYALLYDKEQNAWFADSECMDSNDDKAFLTELMSKFIEKVEVI